jgi:hypothetical protein
MPGVSVPAHCRQSASDSASSESELRQSLVVAVEDDLGEMTRNEFGCAKKTSYVLQLH